MQDFDVTLTADTVKPTGVSVADLKPHWSNASVNQGNQYGQLDSTDAAQVKFQNPKKGGLYKFAFNFYDGCAPCSNSNAQVLLPLGGPDVTDYLMSEFARYDEWVSSMMARVRGKTQPGFARGTIIGTYLGKTIIKMRHKAESYEIASSPCKQYTDETVTICNYVFRRDHIGNFLYAYVSARARLNETDAEIAAAYFNWGASQGPDSPDDLAAYSAGVAYGQNPTADFCDILKSQNVQAMQVEVARKAWPSQDVWPQDRWKTYPTYGGSHGGLTPD